MVLGAIWYAPPVFGRAWQRGVGLSDETLAGGNMAMIYGLAFLLSLAAAWVFAMFLGPRHGPRSVDGRGRGGRSLLGRRLVRHLLLCSSGAAWRCG